jgi:hypothetical protein
LVRTDPAPHQPDLKEVLNGCLRLLPDEFLRALKEGPSPTNQEYFDKMSELGLQWNDTFAPDQKPTRFRLGPK